MSHKQLPEDYALVLQQINEDGGDDLQGLMWTVQVDHNRLRHIVESLHHKGLITAQRIGYGTWFTVSTKGRRFIRQIWPETGMRYQY